MYETSLEFSRTKLNQSFQWLIIEHFFQVYSLISCSASDPAVLRYTYPGECRVWVNTTDIVEDPSCLHSFIDPPTSPPCPATMRIIAFASPSTHWCLHPVQSSQRKSSVLVCVYVLIVDFINLFDWTTLYFDVKEPSLTSLRSIPVWLVLLFFRLSKYHKLPHIVMLQM